MHGERQFKLLTFADFSRSQKLLQVGMSAAQTSALKCLTMKEIGRDLEDLKNRRATYTTHSGL